MGIKSVCFASLLVQFVTMKNSKELGPGGLSWSNLLFRRLRKEDGKFKANLEPMRIKRLKRGQGIHISGRMLA